VDEVAEALPVRPMREALMRWALRVIAVALIVPPIAYLAFFIPLSFYTSHAILNELGLDAVPGVGILERIGAFVRDLLLAVPRAYFAFGLIVWVPTLAGATLYATLRLLPPLRQLGVLPGALLGAACGAAASLLLLSPILVLLMPAAALAGAIAARVSEPIVTRALPAALRGADHAERAVTRAWKALVAAWSAIAHSCDDWAPGAGLSGLFAAIAVAAAVLAVGTWSTAAARDDPLGSLMLPALVALPLALFARRFAQVQHGVVPRGSRTGYLFALGSLAVAIPVGWIASLRP